MTTKPILFNTQMVQAILNGNKIQTRRLKTSDKPQFNKGDVLWVRETWAEADGKYIYRADGEKPVKWKPSIFMPREATRIALEIFDVRHEYLNDIEWEDAIDEGCLGDNPVQTFKALWESINGKGSWEDDPEVWIYSFKRLPA